MNKNIILAGLLILFFSFVLAVEVVNMYGGESRVIYSYNESCSSINVLISASQDIEFNGGGIREYNLEECSFVNNLSLKVDNWSCACAGDGLNITLSTLQNTINTYEFNMTLIP